MAGRTVTVTVMSTTAQLEVSLSVAVSFVSAQLRAPQTKNVAVARDQSHRRVQSDSMRFTVMREVETRRVLVLEDDESGSVARLVRAR